MSQTPIHDNAELGTAMEEWQAFTATLSEAGVAVHQRADPDRTAAEQEQITTALLWTLLAAVAALPQMNRDYPEFAPILNPSVRRIAANVDTIYSVASIRGTGTYRITGRRGTVRIVHLQVVGGSLGTNEKITVLADINLDTCRIDERGWVDIILSPERPDGCEGDWYPLDPSLDAAFVTLRQISYDWLNEIDAQLSIHRVDQPAGQRTLREPCLAICGSWPSTSPRSRSGSWTYRSASSPACRLTGSSRPPSRCPAQSADRPTLTD